MRNVIRYRICFRIENVDVYCLEGVKVIEVQGRAILSKDGSIPSRAVTKSEVVSCLPVNLVFPNFDVRFFVERGLHADHACWSDVAFCLRVI
jgi:hypothetical protein